MSNIQIFNHPQFVEIRTSGTPDNPEFCAMDLCRALGYKNGRDALAKHVDEPDVAKRDMGVIRKILATAENSAVLSEGRNLPSFELVKVVNVGNS